MITFSKILQFIKSGKQFYFNFNTYLLSPSWLIIIFRLHVRSEATSVFFLPEAFRGFNPDLSGGESGFVFSLGTGGFHATMKPGEGGNGTAVTG